MTGEACYAHLYGGPLDGSMRALDEAVRELVVHRPPAVALALDEGACDDVLVELERPAPLVYRRDELHVYGFPSHYRYRYVNRERTS